MKTLKFILIVIAFLLLLWIALPSDFKSSIISGANLITSGITVMLGIK